MVHNNVPSTHLVDWELVNVFLFPHIFCELDACESYTYSHIYFGNPCN